MGHLQKFNGGIYELVETMGFNKVTQSEEEDSVYELYRLNISVGTILELEINHEYESGDTVGFALIHKGDRIYVNANSKKKVKEFINFFH